MADMTKIMDELLSNTFEEEEPEQDVDIYSGRQYDNDVNALGAPEPDEDDYEEDEEEWEYQQEYNEWAEEMEYIDNSYVCLVSNARDTLDEVYYHINDYGHRYWGDEATRIKDLINEISDLVDRLYGRTEDYRSNPEDW